MFHPLPLYVGLRYVRARSTRFFVSFITWASLIGVCVGVAALIVILSVMNGFEGELRDPVRVTATPAAVQTDWPRIAQLAHGIAGVKDAAPYAEIQALAVHQPEM